MTELTGDGSMNEPEWARFSLRGGKGETNVGVHP